MRDYEALNRELRLYDPELAKRPQIVAINKIDLPEVRRKLKTIAAPFKRRGLEPLGDQRRHRRGRAAIARSRLANSRGDAEPDRDFRNVGATAGTGDALQTEPADDEPALDAPRVSASRTACRQPVSIDGRLAKLCKTA